MKLSRINDWIKVLGVHLAGGILAIVEWKIYDVSEYPIYLYVACMISILLVIFYVFSGMFLRNVKTYKVAAVLIGMSIVSGFFRSGTITAMISGGGLVFMQIFSYISEYPKQYIAYSGPISILAPFVITYISMKISRFCEKKRMVKESQEKSEN